jgi:hypothetical protein
MQAYDEEGDMPEAPAAASAVASVDGAPVA